MEAIRLLLWFGAEVTPTPLDPDSIYNNVGAVALLKTHADEEARLDTVVQALPRSWPTDLRVLLLLYTDPGCFCGHHAR